MIRPDRVGYPSKRAPRHDSRFATFEIDEDKRELRAAGRVLDAQPRVFDLRVFLARNRVRVVPKHELLDSVGPDVTVADGSQQRAVSLARLLATLIPHARLVQLEGENHILREDEPAGPRFLDEVRRFVR